MKKIYLIFLFLAITILSISVQKHRYALVSHQEIWLAKKYTRELSKQEKKSLHAFLKRATVMNVCSYTWGGNKPMTIVNFSKDDVEMNNGWAIWESFLPLFQRQGYHIARYEDLNNRPYYEIVVFSIPLCRSVIAAHLQPFQEFIGEQSDVEGVLNILLNHHDPRFLMIMKNEYFLGLLLGFGGQNAVSFAAGKYDQMDFSFSLPWWQNFVLEGVWPPVGWLMPSFRCDLNTEETKGLLRQYAQDRKAIFWTYLGYDLVDVTFALLMHPNP